MRLLITRHSKTIWNEQRRLQGRKDSKLTQKGIEEARILGEFLKGEQIDVIYSSPINRAYQTAQMIFPDREIITDDRLMEMSFGDYEGKSVAELVKQKDYHDLWHNPSLDSRLPHGESYREIKERLQSFYEEIKTRHASQTVFVVTHGMAFIVLQAVIKNLCIEDLTSINQEVVRGCSLTEIMVGNNSAVIERIGDSSFLPSDNLISFNK
ncbi:MAG: histidine phosphatase family protein [Erysipelotrichaceae bacterium]|nr:histidine phosphatase family protein [Erysipelotrichaceae bacterium]